MDSEYELFERRPDGVLTWRGVVQGLAAVQVRTRLLAVETGNEIFAMRSGDRQIIARVIPEEAVTEAA